MRRGFQRTAAVLAATVFLFCSGCSWDWGQPAPSPGEPDVARYRAEYADRWCYRGLSQRLQTMYDAVYTAVRECRTDTWVSIRGGVEAQAETDYIGLKVSLPVALADSGEARRLFNAFTADNPQFFFVGNTYSYEGYRLDGTDYYDEFCLTLTMDAAERQKAAQRLEEQVKALLAICPKGVSAYETELWLHDTLAQRITYDDETAQSTDPAAQRPAAFSAYGALVEGSAVCEGYSRAMQLLLHRMDIPCTLVSGRSLNGEAHMWNLTEINGRGYHLDLTWNDAEDRLNHTYFNLTTEEILLSHTLDEENLGVDTCTATESNYFVKEGRYLDTYDRSLIAEAVAAQVQTGAARVELRFASDKFANAQLFFSNSRRLAQYVDPFLIGMALGEYTCRANETYHTLTLYRETM